MNVTKNLAEYLKSTAVNIAELSRRTGIPYQTLYASVGEEGRGRELKADELTSICRVLNLNPMDFADNPTS